MLARRLIGLLLQEPVNFTTGIAQEIFQSDFQRVSGGKYLDFGDVTQLPLLNRPPAPVANVGNHAGNLSCGNKKPHSRIGGVL